MSLRPHIVVALAATLLAVGVPAAAAAPVDPPTTFGVPELAPGCPDPSSDCTPPSDTTSGPAVPGSGWFTSAPVDVTLGGADEVGGSGLARIEYSVDGGAPADGTDTQVVSLSGDGDHAIAHRAVDNAGNASGWQLEDYAIDTVAPVNTTPETNVSGVASYTETITGTDADPGSGISQVFWTVDGGPTQTGNPVSIAADGTHTLVTWVADAAGNLSLSHTQTITVDAAPPVDTTVVDPAWRTSSPVTITLSGTDGGGPADHMEYVLDGFAATAGSGDPLTVGGDGTHTLKHRAVDAAGNKSAWVTDTVKIDTTSPVNTTTASALWSASDQHVSVSGTDATSGVKEVQWQVDGGAIGTHAGGSAVDVTVTGEGQHSVKTQVVDNAGNASGWRTDTVKVDTVTPVDLTSVNAGWQKTTQTVAVTGADPSGSGVASVEWSLDDGAVTTVAAATTNVTVSGDGQHTLLTRITDGVGHKSGWKSSTVSIDSTAPNNLTIPTDPNAWSKGNVSVQLDGADGGSGLSAMEYKLDGGAPASVPAGRVIAITGDGPHTLQSRAVDVAGNASGWRSDTVHIDTAVPTDTTSVTSPVAYGVKATISGTDALAGIDHVEWNLDGTDGSGASGSQVALGGNGPHVLKHRVVDKAGNASAWVTSNVTVDTSLNHDTTAPVDTTTVPAGWVTTPSYTVSVTGTDANTTVDHVEWRLDGGGPQTGPSGSAFTVSGDGQHHFETRVADVAGNVTAWVDRVVRIDTANPTDSTPAPAWQSTRTVKLDGADAGSGIDHMEWWLDGGAKQTGAAGTTITLPSDGTFTLEHRAVDVAGNVSPRRTDTLHVDTVVPLDTTPATPSGWQTSAYAVAPAGSDAGSGVDHAEARLDGDPVAELPFTVDSDGTHTISTRVVDVAGNASAWRDQTVKVDLHAPSDTTPDAPAGWLDAPWTVSPAADDGDGSGVTSVEWKLGEAGVVSTDPSVTISAEGETVLLTRATDAVGHTSAWRRQTVRIDTVAPTPGVACAASGAPTGYTCTATATDATSGIGALRWRVDGGAWKAPAADGTFAVAKGRVEVQATDRAGHTATAAKTLAERVVPPPVTVPAAPGPVPAPAPAPAPGPTHTKTRTVLVRKLGTHRSSGLLGGFELHAIHRGSEPVTGNADVRPLSLGKGRFRVTIRLVSGQLTAQRRRTMTFKRGGYSPRMGVALTGVRKRMAARLTVERRVRGKWRRVAVAKATLKP